MNKSLYFVLSHEEQYDAVSKTAGKQVHSTLHQYCGLLSSRARLLFKQYYYIIQKIANFFFSFCVKLVSVICEVCTGKFVQKENLFK